MLAAFGGKEVRREEGPHSCVMAARSDVFHLGWWEAEGKTEVKAGGERLQ